MMVLGGWVVSYERGTPVGMGPTARPREEDFSHNRGTGEQRFPHLLATPPQSKERPKVDGGDVQLSTLETKSTGVSHLQEPPPP